MIQGNISFRVILIGLCLLSVAQAQSKNNSVSVDDVKKESVEFVKTLKQYSFQQRDKAIKETEEAIVKIDNQIDHLEKRVDDQWDKMTKVTQKESRESLKALRKQRYKLSEWYGSMKNSSESAWDQMRRGFTDAYQSLSNSWQKALQEFEGNG